jgi:hypothetical protein
MKNVFLILVLLLITPEVKSQWEFAGLSNATVNVFTSNGTDLYAGTGYGIYRALNNGANWIQAGLNGNIINSLATSPGKIYGLKSVSSGVWVSINNGLTFNDLFYYADAPMGIAVRDNFVYIGFNVPRYEVGLTIGVYLTTNNGTNWTHTSLNNEFTQTLLINNNYMYCGTISHGLFYSTDYGINWTQSNLNNRTVRSIAVNGNYAYAGTEIGGVYISSDYGINWTQTNMNNKSIFSVVSDGNYLFAGTFGEGVFLSTNNGDTWLQKNQGLGNLYANAFIVFNNYVYAGTNNGIWRRSLQEIISINTISTEIPKNFNLYQNYPNPFNPSTKIKFEIPPTLSPSGIGGNPVLLKVYDITGREIQKLVNEPLKPGVYEKTFDGSKLSSGIYFYSLIVDGKSIAVKKMVMVK